MATALISLGSNVGDRAAAIRDTLDRLAQWPGARVTASSSLHKTSPAGGPESQQKFLNAAALLETNLPPLELLSVLQRIENEFGRVRDQRWGPRTIDLDLLLYDQLELETPELTLPHPRMSFRRFVLEPAAEIAPGMVHPMSGNTIGGLLNRLNHSPRCIAIVDLGRASRIELGDPRFIVVPPSALLEPEHARLPDMFEGIENHWLIIQAENLLAHEALIQVRLLIVLTAASDLAPLRDWIRTEHRGPALVLAKCSADQLRDEVLAASAAME